MNKENEPQNLSDSIASKIKRGQIKMRPKAYFIAKLAILLIGMSILTVVTLFLVSFILFSIRQSGLLFLPNFGFPGMKILILSLPWLLILGVIALVITSEVFAKHFSFVYRQPMLYSFLAIIIFAILGGVALDFTPFHANLLTSARNGKLPIAGPFYREMGSPKMKNAFYGSIFEITNSGFKINTPQSDELNIVVGPKTKNMDSDLEVGDSVLILGKKINLDIEASDIKKVEETHGFLPGPKFPNRPTIKDFPGSLRRP